MKSVAEHELGLAILSGIDNVPAFQEDEHIDDEDEHIDDEDEGQAIYTRLHSIPQCINASPNLSPFLLFRSIYI